MLRGCHALATAQLGRHPHSQAAAWPARQRRLCAQSNKPLQKLKRKTVYFVKLQPTRLDNDNINKEVRRTHCWGARQESARSTAVASSPCRLRYQPGARRRSAILRFTAAVRVIVSPSQRCDAL